MDVAALDVLDQAVQGLVQAAVVDRQRVLVARECLRAEREHQRVVLDRLAALGVDDLLVRVDPVELVASAARRRRRCTIGASG